MRRARPLCAAAVLLAALALPLGAAEKLGTVTYVEGDLALERDGEEIEGVQVGQDLQNFDVLQTGPDGLAEIEVSSGKSPRMTLKISPATRFSFELSRVGSRQQASVGLIGGTISLKCAKLAGNQLVSVKSDAAAMGVRGTQFTVTSPPSGDILVTCDEGEVLCTDEDGSELTAVPGTVVEKRPGELFRAVPVAVSALESFRRDWNAERIGALRANALRAIRVYAASYRALSREFDRNWAELMKRQAVISKWQAEDRKGRLGTRLELLREKKDIVGHLFALRKTLFRFERIYFRLLELQGYHDQGFGRGALEDGETTGAFFQMLQREKREMLRRMAAIRYVAKLYALRNDGRVPTGAFDEKEESESEFFDE